MQQDNAAVIHLICALRAEAAPLIQQYRLVRVSQTGLPLWQNHAAGISLTVSGVGKQAAADAVTFTREALQGDPADAWLNTGICGHASATPGATFLVTRVRDASSGRSWYPQVCFPAALPPAELTTVEQPEKRFADGLYDMECSGYMDAAGRISGCELVHAIKIVSDNLETGTAVVSAARATELVALAVPHIEPVISALQQLSAQCHALYSTPVAVGELAASMHFTVSQRIELEKLVRRWQALYGDTGYLTDGSVPAGNARELLQAIRGRLEEAPLRFDRVHNDV